MNAPEVMLSASDAAAIELIREVTNSNMPLSDKLANVIGAANMLSRQSLIPERTLELFGGRESFESLCRLCDQFLVALSGVFIAERDGHELLDEDGKVIASAPENCGCRVAVPGFIEGPVAEMFPLVRGNIVRKVRGRRQRCIELDATWHELGFVLINPVHLDPDSFSCDPWVIAQRLREMRRGRAT